MIPSRETALMQTMTESQRLLFTTRMEGARKSRTTALLLTLFLGGIGAHRFYLGQVGLGIFYLVFFWSFIPLIVSLVELFLIGARVDSYNEDQAYEIAAEIRMLKPSAAAQALS